MSADRIERLVKDAFWHIDEWSANRQSGPETANSVKACLHEIDSLVRGLLATPVEGEDLPAIRSLCREVTHAREPWEEAVAIAHLADLLASHEEREGEDAAAAFERIIRAVGISVDGRTMDDVRRLRGDVELVRSRLRSHTDREPDPEIGRLLRESFTAPAWRRLAQRLRDGYDEPGPLQADTEVFDRLDRIGDLIGPPVQPEEES